MKASWADGKFFVTDINFFFQVSSKAVNQKIALYIIEKIMSLAIAITHVLFFLSPHIS